jgi:hypothetical protein
VCEQLALVPLPSELVLLQRERHLGAVVRRKQRHGGPRPHARLVRLRVRDRVRARARARVRLANPNPNADPDPDPDPNPEPEPDPNPDARLGRLQVDDALAVAERALLGHEGRGGGHDLVVEDEIEPEHLVRGRCRGH